jgi:predicted nucleic acid-binding protein
MAYLADTNIAARWVLPSDPQYATIRSAIFTLQERKEIVYITPQVLIEFHALATRPPEANGLGWTLGDARREASRIESVFPLLPATETIYTHWVSLIDRYDITGRQVYDTRLMAVMQAHGITHILTLNPTHFRRFVEITVVEPQDIS